MAGAALVLFLVADAVRDGDTDYLSLSGMGDSTISAVGNVLGSTRFRRLSIL